MSLPPLPFYESQIVLTLAQMNSEKINWSRMFLPFPLVYCDKPTCVMRNIWVMCANEDASFYIKIKVRITGEKAKLSKLKGDNVIRFQCHIKSLWIFWHIKGNFDKMNISVNVFNEARLKSYITPWSVYVNAFTPDLHQKFIHT